jgi:hypothetical protein
MADTVLLDTGIVSMFLKASSVHQQRRTTIEAEIRGKIAVISFVTVAELFFGQRRRIGASVGEPISITSYDITAFCMQTGRRQRYGHARSRSASSPASRSEQTTSGSHRQRSSMEYLWSRPIVTSLLSRTLRRLGYDESALKGQALAQSMPCTYCPLRVSRSPAASASPLQT